jgi:hypothetical protein
MIIGLRVSRRYSCRSITICEFSSHSRRRTLRIFIDSGHVDRVGAIIDTGHPAKHHSCVLQKTCSVTESLRRPSDMLDAPLDPRGTLFDPRNVLGLREVWSSQLCVGCGTADNALPVVYVQHMSENEDQLPVTGSLHLGVIGESPVRRQPSTLSSLVRLPVCCCAGFLQERVAPLLATPRPDLDQLAYIVSHSNVVSATYR